MAVVRGDDKGICGTLYCKEPWRDYLGAAGNMTSKDKWGVTINISLLVPFESVLKLFFLRRRGRANSSFFAYTQLFRSLLGMLVWFTWR